MKNRVHVVILLFALGTNATPIFAEEISDAVTSLLDYDVQVGEIALMWLGNHQ